MKDEGGRRGTSNAQLSTFNFQVAEVSGGPLKNSGVSISDSISDYWRHCGRGGEAGARPLASVQAL